MARIHITNFDKSFSNSKASTSSIPQSGRLSTSSQNENVIRTQESSRHIPHKIYREESSRSVKTGSPTPSEINFTINVIEAEEFIINRTEINDEFMQKKNKIFRKWYFKKNTLLQNLICLKQNFMIKGPVGFHTMTSILG